VCIWIRAQLIRPTTPCVLTTLFCLRRLREAVVLRVKEWVFFNFICILKLLVIFLWVPKKNNLGPDAITVIGRLCPFVVDPCLSVGPLFGLGVVFFDSAYLWTRQTSNHTFCRLRDIQDNLYILIVTYKIQKCIYSINNIFK